MKKKILITFIALVTLLSTINVNALVEPTPEFYINDYANILSEETENYILNKSVALEKATSAQVVVVTVPNLEGQTIEEYATDLFRSYGIGNAEENNGLLLLLALEEREFRVEVGYGLEGVLPDGLTGRYQDQYIIPYLSENRWDEGIKNGYNAFVQKICEYYEITNLEIEEVTLLPADDTYEYDESEGFPIAFTLGFIFGLVIAISSDIKTVKKESKTKKNIFTIIVLLLNIISILILSNVASTTAGFLHFIIEILTIFWIKIASRSGNTYSRGRGYRGGSSFGGRSSSSGGFRGGGGRSGGGGSTRRF